MSDLPPVSSSSMNTLIQDLLEFSKQHTVSTMYTSTTNAYIHMYIYLYICGTCGLPNVICLKCTVGVFYWMDLIILCLMWAF